MQAAVVAQRQQKRKPSFLQQTCLLLRVKSVKGTSARESQEATKMVKEEKGNYYGLLTGTKPECYLDNSIPLPLQMLQMAKVA